ncbi:hypothetical protein VPH35_086832 [Triticum aestivum]
MSCPSVAAASPAPATALDGGVLLEHILLRLPPQPSSLRRASLVCTRWRRILSSPGFLRRFREHHSRNKPPPLLGFFDKQLHADKPPIFNPTTMGQRDRIPPARFTVPWSRCQGWECEALVWDSLTGHQRRVSFPPVFSLEQGKFVQNAVIGLVCLYESETGVWGNIITVGTTHSVYTSRPSVLVRDAFCWLLSEGAILEFDFQSQSIAVIQKPADANPVDYWSFIVVRTESSGLGLAVLPKSECPSKSIQLWERKCNLDGVVGWELQKTIQLDVLFSLGSNVVMMQGYDKDSNSILLSTFFGSGDGGRDGGAEMSTQ